MSRTIRRHSIEAKQGRNGVGVFVQEDIELLKDVPISLQL